MDIGGDEIDKILLNAGAALNAQQNGGDNPDVNISDVLDAIDRAESSHTVDDMSQSVRPYVEITEQPASKEIRFRYECEGRSAGSIPGATSTPENKTYPAIKIHGYLGPATIVASCITKEGFLVHPHNLVGKNCNQGVCSFRVTVKEDAREFQFKNVGIQCVKRQNITTAINNRMRHGIDPFRKGFEHQNNPLKIDLNCVRLAIQVIVKDERGNDVSLRPVFTNVIFDKKSSGDLLITRASHCSGPAGGGTQVILLCNKLVQGARDDTVVAFYELAGDAEVWTKEVAPSLVHKQYAIVFEVPAYRDPLADRHVTVRYQLRRRSDRECSNWLPFEYIPAAPGTRKPLPDLAALAALLRPAPASPAPSPPPSPPSPPSPGTPPSPADGLTELLEQVAELDEIYSESRTRAAAAPPAARDDDFDDAGTYTSLQLAFRNPVPLDEPYEDVLAPPARPPPLVEYTALRDADDAPAPPLPPKRVRRASRGSSAASDAVRPGRRLPLAPARSEPALPPPKKRSFLSRLFRRRSRSPAASLPAERAERAEPRRAVGRSASSASGRRPARFADGLRAADSVTHISLHGDGEEEARCSRPASLGALPPDGTILVAESVLALDAAGFARLRDELELSEAEHYALYMAVAPHATCSEFDDTSCYYSPVDAPAPPERA